jgi:phosphate transport system substrate-binding protein
LALELSLTRTVFAILIFVLATSSQLADSEPPFAKHDETQPNSDGTETRILGAGSQALDPLVMAWIDEYGSLHPGTRILYQALGSKAGLLMLTAGTTSFGTADIPISDDQLTLADGRLLQFPVAVTAVVPVYNLAEVHGLRFSSSTLADIFLGRITKWNASAIMEDNPGADLPPIDIKVKHYFPNGSVETHIMADYLSKTSSSFKMALTTSSGDWPLASIGYKGAEGTAGFVSETPGSIGYLGLVPARLYEHQGSLKCGAVKNSNGDFVTASSESLVAASGSAVPFIHAQVADFRISITDAPGKTSYPIASFIWLILYEKPDESPEGRRKSEVTKDFLKWVLTDGQKLALKLGYPPLPRNLVELELQDLRVSGKE